jgi:RND family efflux transporter MFP subunit
MTQGFWFRFARVILVIAAALLIAALLLLLRPRAQRQALEEPGLLVAVAAAKPRRIQMVVETNGNVEARDPLALVAEVPGQVVGLHPGFTEGGRVACGAELIRIDPRTYSLEVARRRVQLRQAGAELTRLAQEESNLQASIGLARSDVALAKDELTRYQQLNKKQVVAPNTLDKARQRFLSSRDRLQALQNQLALVNPRRALLEAQTDAARLALQQAELDLERSCIVAPFDGWVLQKTVETGQYVSGGQLLGRIYRAGALDVTVNIQFKELQWLPSDWMVDGAAEAEIRFHNGAMTLCRSGRVARLKAALEAKTRTLPVVIEISPEVGAVGDEKHRDRWLSRLRPGMFVTVRIKGRSLENIFVLPRHWLHSNDTVYLFDAGRLRIRSVGVARRFEDKIYVNEGLAEGELIVSSPVSAARDGMLLRRQDDTG